MYKRREEKEGEDIERGMKWDCIEQGNSGHLPIQLETLSNTPVGAGSAWQVEQSRRVGTEKADRGTLFSNALLPSDDSKTLLEPHTI